MNRVEYIRNLVRCYKAANQAGLGVEWLPTTAGLTHCNPIAAMLRDVVQNDKAVDAFFDSGDFDLDILGEAIGHDMSVSYQFESIEINGYVYARDGNESRLARRGDVVDHYDVEVMGYENGDATLGVVIEEHSGLTADLAESIFQKAIRNYPGAFSEWQGEG